MPAITITDTEILIVGGGINHANITQLWKELDQRGFVVYRTRGGFKIRISDLNNKEKLTVMTYIWKYLNA